MRERRALKLRQKNRYNDIARSIVDNNNNSFFICQAFFEGVAFIFRLTINTMSIILNYKLIVDYRTVVHSVLFVVSILTLIRRRKI